MNLEKNKIKKEEEIVDPRSSREGGDRNLWLAKPRSSQFVIRRKYHVDACSACLASLSDYFNADNDGQNQAPPPSFSLAISF